MTLFRVPRGHLVVAFASVASMCRASGAIAWPRCISAVVCRPRAQRSGGSPRSCGLSLVSQLLAKSHSQPASSSAAKFLSRRHPDQIAGSLEPLSCTDRRLPNSSDARAVAGTCNRSSRDAIVLGGGRTASAQAVPFRAIAVGVAEEELLGRNSRSCLSSRDRGRRPAIERIRRGVDPGDVRVYHQRALLVDVCRAPLRKVVKTRSSGG